MIRRRVGDEFWLIPQHDHALVSGELAKHFGNDRFAKPQDATTVLGISLHDCGWPTHDDCPTLNREHLPLDVFETSPKIGLNVWTESAKRATAQDAYAGLLVSLHSLSLSALATSQVFDNDQFDLNNARVRFEVNKFQHTQIELQEKLRSQLGMRTDIPLNLGISQKSSDPREQKLEFDLRLLQAMDKLSLCICCTKPPFASVEPVLDRPGGKVMSLQVRRLDASKLTVSPWPFDVAKIDVTIPYRRVSIKPFTDEQTFQSAYSSATTETFGCTVVPA